eukprot:s199_g30.t1
MRIHICPKTRRWRSPEISSDLSPEIFSSSDLKPALGEAPEAHKAPEAHEAAIYGRRYCEVPANVDQGFKESSPEILWVTWMRRESLTIHLRISAANFGRWNSGASQDFKAKLGQADQAFRTAGKLQSKTRKQQCKTHTEVENTRVHVF